MQKAASPPLSSGALLRQGGRSVKYPAAGGALTMSQCPAPTLDDERGRIAMMRSSEGMKLVRADLVRRIDMLDARLRIHGPVGLSRLAAEVASIAGQHGLRPAQRLAEGLAVALAQGGRGAAILPWTDQLREACRCEATDEASGSTWLASVLSRLAG
jgi:hypothetical protein